MPRSSDRAVRGTDVDDALDYDLSRCSLPSGSDCRFTDEWRRVNALKRGGDEELSTVSNHTAQSATFISKDLLMLPTVNCVKRDPKAAAKPEQPWELHKQMEPKISLLECPHLPHFVRSAPLWLKLLITLTSCIILFAACFYVGATLLKESQDSTNDPASQIVLDRDADLLDWKANGETLAPTPMSTPESTQSLQEWAEGLTSSTTTPPP